MKGKFSEMNNAKIPGQILRDNPAGCDPPRTNEQIFRSPKFFFFWLILKDLIYLWER